jgi:hypothetical protein
MSALLPSYKEREATRVKDEMSKESVSIGVKTPLLLSLTFRQLKFNCRRQADGKTVTVVKNSWMTFLTVASFIPLK